MNTPRNTRTTRTGIRTGKSPFAYFASFAVHVLILCSAPATFAGTGAWIFGTNVFANTTGSGNVEIHFQPLSNRVVLPNGALMRTYPITITTDTNGSIGSNYFVAGPYRVSTPETTDTFVLVAPSDEAAHDWVTLGTNSFNFVSSIASTFIRVNQGSGTSNSFTRPRLFETPWGTNSLGSSNYVWTLTNGLTGEGEWREPPSSGGGEVSTAQLNTTSNTLYGFIIGGGVSAQVATNIAQYFATNSALITSNALVTLLVANDNATSNALRTLLVGNDTISSNGAVAFGMASSNNLAALFISYDTITSNGAVAFTMSASNNLASLLAANDTTTSNALRTLLIGNDTITSNGAVAFTMTASNSLVSLLAGYDTTTSNALRTLLIANDTISSNGAIAFTMTASNTLALLARGELNTASNFLYGIITGGSGEVNVNGEKGVTNSTTFGLVWGKEGVSNLLRSLTPGYGLSGTNRGTNIDIAIDPTIIPSQTELNAASNALFAAETTRNAAVSNAAVAFTMTASNSLVSLLAGYDTTTSNALRTLLIGNDTITSNGAVAFTMTASNTLALLARGELNTASNYLYGLITAGGIAVNSGGGTNNSFTNFTAYEKATFERSLIMPWRAGIVGAVYATNGAQQFYTLGVSTNMNFVPLSGSDGSNSIAILVAFTQNSTGGYYPSNNGSVIVVRTNALATTLVTYSLSNGATNASPDVPFVATTPPTNGQTWVYNVTDNTWNPGTITSGSASDALVTNVVSASLSNATSKPILRGVVNRTAELMGVQGGANIAISSVGTNYEIAVTGIAGAGVDQAANSITVTQGVYELTRTLAADSTTNLIVDYGTGGAKHFVIVLTTNTHLVITNLRDGIFNSSITILQDTNGNRSITSLRVAGGLLVTNSTILSIDTNASAQTRWNLASFFTTNAVIGNGLPDNPTFVTVTASTFMAGSTNVIGELAGKQSTSTVLGNLAGTRAFTNKTITVMTNLVIGNYTVPAGCTYVEIEGVGAGGGGGGGSGAASQSYAAGGGGSGAYFRTNMTVTPGATYVVTIGALGGGGAAGANAGTNGGTTSFTNLCSAPGGSGGAGQAASTAPKIALGGSGATVATGGIISLGGQPGQPGVTITNNVNAIMSGNGGSTIFGGGGLGVNGAAGNNGTGYGSGGSGAAATGNNNRAGGDGRQGAIFITEYYR